MISTVPFLIFLPRRKVKSTLTEKKNRKLLYKLKVKTVKRCWKLYYIWDVMLLLVKIYNVIVRLTTKNQNRFSGKSVFR